MAAGSGSTAKKPDFGLTNIFNNTTVRHHVVNTSQALKCLSFLSAVKI